MKVKVIWEFDADVSDFDEKHVDAKGLAKDLTQQELDYLLKNNELSIEDFAYEVVEDDDNELLKENDE